jgi:hypothetical protein
MYLKHMDEQLIFQMQTGGSYCRILQHETEAIHGDWGGKQLSSSGRRSFLESVIKPFCGDIANNVILINFACVSKWVICKEKCKFNVEVSWNGGTPNNPTKIDDLGVPYFGNPPYMKWFKVCHHISTEWSESLPQKWSDLYGNAWKLGHCTSR